MADLIYRLMRPEEASVVSNLVLSVFDEFIAPEYTPQGVEEFRRYASPQALADRSGEDHFVIIGTTPDAGPPAGMVEVRQNNHIALLFVAASFQRQGVARALLDHALAEARRRGGEPQRVTVNSSRFGVPAYESLGFRQTGPERAVNGIVFIPMAKRVGG